MRVTQFAAQLDSDRCVLSGDVVTGDLSIAEYAVGLESGIRIFLPGREIYCPQQLRLAGGVVMIGEQHTARCQQRTYRTIRPTHLLRKFDTTLEQRGCL